MLSVDATQVKIVQYKIGEKDFSDCDLGWRDYNPTNNLEEIIKYFRSKLNFFQKSLKCIHCNAHIRFEESWHSAVSSGGIFSFASLWVEKILSFTQIIALPKQLNKSTFSVLVRREIFFLIYKILNFFCCFQVIWSLFVEESFSRYEWNTFLFCEFIGQWTHHKYTRELLCSIETSS